MGELLLKYRPVKAMRNERTVYWLYGPTGSGKSYAVAQFCMRLLATRNWPHWKAMPGSKWFDGYHGQKIAWFDDYRFNGSREEFASHLRLTDRYDCRVQIKGGTANWDPDIIIYTHPKSITDCFSSVAELEDLGQFKRRVTREFDFGGIGKLQFAELIQPFLVDTGNDERLVIDLADAVEDSTSADTASVEDESDCEEKEEKPLMPPRLKRYMTGELYTYIMEDSEDESDDTV